MYFKSLLVLLVALLFLTDSLSSFVIPDRQRPKRNSYRSDQMSSPQIYELSDLADLFPAHEGGLTQDWEPNPGRYPSFISPIEPINVPVPAINRRKTKDKKRRITVPLDPIGSSHLSTRSRKEEPGEFKEHFAE